MGDAAGEDKEEGGKVVVDDSGVYGSRFFATKDGFVVEGMAAAEEGVEGFVAAGLTEESKDIPSEKNAA